MGNVLTVFTHYFRVSLLFCDIGVMLQKARTKYTVLVIVRPSAPLVLRLLTTHIRHLLGATGETEEASIVNWAFKHFGPFPNHWLSIAVPLSVGCSAR